MFCKFNTTFSRGSHKYKIENFSFNYTDKTISIISKVYELSFQQLEETIPFLYSEKQVINIEESKDLYDLKFKIVEYNNEELYII